jgi:hypothetical protein
MMLLRAWPVLSLLVASAACAAGDTPGDSRPFKLTLGDYRYSGGYSGIDLNLRWRRNDTSAWLATYRDRAFGSQSRAGFDTTIDVAEHVTVQPSMQIASRGFIGGSVNLQAGDTWFGLVGLGRTNLKPYFNLNFDPNDAITLGGGHRTAGGSVYTVFVVADDRLHTHQKHWHLNARVPVGQSRATLDLLHKTGEGDSSQVNAWGWSATWDWPTWFVRLARDPKQNFSEQDAWRLGAGMRF